MIIADEVINGGTASRRMSIYLVRAALRARFSQEQFLLFSLMSFP